MPNTNRLFILRARYLYLVAKVFLLSTIQDATSEEEKQIPKPEKIEDLVSYVRYLPSK